MVCPHGHLVYWSMLMSTKDRIMQYESGTEIRHVKLQPVLKFCFPPGNSTSDSASCQFLLGGGGCWFKCLGTCHTCRKSAGFLGSWLQSGAPVAGAGVREWISVHKLFLSFSHCTLFSFPVGEKSSIGMNCSVENHWVGDNESLEQN